MRDPRDGDAPARARRGVRHLAARVPLLGLPLVVVLAAPPVSAAGARDPGGRLPDILVLCVDTLRADRLSSYGYERPTSPAIDGLLARGTVFSQARTVEPLTGPASASMITSRFPHEHGATRNGLQIRPGLESLPKLLARRGYKTAAVVGNWSLRDELTGLSEHFDHYQEVFSRKQWFGLFNSEATGDDLTAAALAFVEEHEEASPTRPFFLWIHYVEPHAPYRYWKEFGRRLQLDPSLGMTKGDRYDTEIAFTDRQVGHLLRGLSVAGELPEETLVVFVADHGESLGDHDYWGHGRYLFENSLRIPMGIVWPHRVPVAEVAQPALILDLAPTVAGLLGLPEPGGFRGLDWSPVLRGETEAPDRATYYQAHRGTVQTDHASRRARLDGLLEVARVTRHRKEVLDVRDGTVRIYDLARDPGELENLAPPGTEPSPELVTWHLGVREGLEAASDLPPAALDAEAVERLRALGYLD